jgi:D-serine deaminase-like pyridoxal phosphate-dependent protein
VLKDIYSNEIDDSIFVERLSEEHCILKVKDNCKLNIGDKVRIIPNHACAVSNLSNEFTIVSENKVIDKWKVDARGKVW